jgi:prepilin-type N-terminal cleavage/methylation domain-containing protein
MTDKYSKRTRGFTLVELSIVIIIIGFLIAGVTAGKSLINAAQLSSIISDYQQFQLAYTGFVDRYRAVPGDMINATSYWPNDGTCGETASNCNGNGDGLITYGGSEMHSFWKELSLSGLISAPIAVVPDTYTGQELGVNIYQSKLSNAGYSIASDRISHYVNFEHAWSKFGENVNAIFLAQADTNANASGQWGSATSYSVPEFDYAVLDVESTFNIDQKIDDAVFDTNGNPIGAYTGNVRVNGIDVTNGTECIVNFFPGSKPGIYNLAGKNCIIGMALKSGTE